MIMAEDKGKQHQQHGKAADKGQRERESFQKSFGTQDSKEDKDLRLIVRIAGIDLDGRKPIERSMTRIKGIGIRMAKNIAVAYEKTSGILAGQKTGKLTEEQSKKLEEVVLNPAKFGVPEWSLNKRKDFYTGKSSHLVMSELDLGLRSDLQRMTETKSYKGLRHTWGLPVRGQRTKSTHRGKGGIVGVMKKDAVKAGQAAAPAKAAPAAGKKEEKK